MLDSLRSEAGFGRGRANAIGFAAGTTFELEQALPDGTRALLNRENLRRIWALRENPYDVVIRLGTNSIFKGP